MNMAVYREGEGGSILVAPLAVDFSLFGNCNPLFQATKRSINVCVTDWKDVAGRVQDKELSTSNRITYINCSLDCGGPQAGVGRGQPGAPGGARDRAGHARTVQNWHLQSLGWSDFVGFTIKRVTSHLTRFWLILFSALSTGGACECYCACQVYGACGEDDNSRANISSHK